jgi:hypothetical protein
MGRHLGNSIKRFAASKAKLLVLFGRIRKTQEMVHNASQLFSV